VRLTAKEWALVLESLRRFATELEAVGRPDRALVAHPALSKLVTYRVSAGGEAVDDESWAATTGLDLPGGGSSGA
jgi:hypothetical protein